MSAHRVPRGLFSMLDLASGMWRRLCVDSGALYGHELVGTRRQWWHRSR
jgi:hypothetical protein